MAKFRPTIAAMMVRSRFGTWNMRAIVRDPRGNRTFFDRIDDDDSVDGHVALAKILLECRGQFGFGDFDPGPLHRYSPMEELAAMGRAAAKDPGAYGLESVGWVVSVRAPEDAPPLAQSWPDEGEAEGKATDATD